MIKASKADRPTPWVLTRSKTMSVERLSPTEFRVTPCEEGKVVRIVRFHPEYDEPENEMVAAFIECFDQTTYEDCPASAHSRLCSHANAAINLLLETTFPDREEEIEIP